MRCSKKSNEVKKANEGNELTFYCRALPSLESNLSRVIYWHLCFIIIYQICTILSQQPCFRNRMKWKSGLWAMVLVKCNDRSSDTVVCLQMSWYKWYYQLLSSAHLYVQWNYNQTYQLKEKMYNSMKKKEMNSLDICPPDRIRADDEDASEPSISLLEVMQALLPIPRLCQPISSTLRYFDQKNCQHISSWLCNLHILRYLQTHLKLEIRLLYFRSFLAFHFRRIA